MVSRWRWAGAAIAVLLVAAPTVADASKGRLNGERPYWAAHGRVIAFDGWFGRATQDERLWMMNADGTRRRPIAAAGGGASLSPTGRMVAERFYTNANYGVLDVGRPGRKPIKTFKLRGTDYGGPVWAPDESAVAVEVLTDSRAMIFVADLRTGVRSISRVASRDDESPAWSPDSRRIAIVTCASLGGDCNLAVMRRDGSHRHVLVRGEDSYLREADQYTVDPV